MTRTQAAAVPLANPSFEAPVLSAGTWTYNLQGWTDAGPPNNTSRFIEFISGFRADGNQHLGMEQGAVIWQDLTATYQPDTVYRLRVAVGRRQNFTQSGNLSSYTLTEPSGALSKNGTFNASTIGTGTFAEAPVLEVNTALSNAFVGKTIQVRLSAGGTGRSQFDNVRLEAVPNITILDYYRMGDDDPGVLPSGGAVFSSTKDSVGTKDLSAIGVPFWSPDVSSAASSHAGSSYSLWFFNGGPYATAPLLSTVTDNFGIEAWVKPTSSTGNHCIAYNGNTGANGWGLYQVGNTYQGIFGGVAWVGSGPLTLNAWTHVALVRTGGSARLYINGIAAGNATSAAPKVPAGGFAVATQPQAPGLELWAGYVDEVRIFTISPGQFSTNDLLINALLKPPTVFAQSAWPSTATEASLSASINPRSQSTTAGFEWGLTTSYGNRTTLANTISGSTPVACNLAISGLAPMTTYHFRSFASNTGGSIAGPDSTFTTPPTPPVVVTLPPASMAGSGATLNGSVNPSGSPSIAWFEWGLRQGAYANLTRMGGFNGTSVFPFSTNLTGLTPGLIYHSRVAATNGGGITRGHDVRFGSPAIRINGPTSTTNLLFSAYNDPGAAAFNAPLAVACGDFHSLGLRADGTVASWGNNQYGQINIPASATNVTAIGAAGTYSMALRSDGTIISWGTNLSGSLLFPASATNISVIAVGAFHSLALRADGTIVGTGRNDSGQINVPAGATNVVAIAAGNYHSLALRADGTVLAWGDNGWGQINLPPSATNVVAIVAGEFHSLALRTDGTIVGWGDNRNGQITIPGGATNVVAIAAGHNHSLALKADGTVIGWGDNTFGQLNFPSSATNIVAITTRYTHSLALRADGTVVGCGDNSQRQLNVPDLGTLPMNTSGSVNTNAIGTYALTYSSTNILGGATSASRTVVVEAAPVVTQSATLLSGRLATLNGSINPRGVATAYYFQYGTNASYGSFTPTNNLPAGSSLVAVSMTITGLKPGTTYHFRAVSVNGWGIATGADVTMTTLLLPWVATLPATTVINGGATLNASVNPGGDTATAWFEWGSTSTFGNATAARLLSGTNSISVSTNLTGLIPDSTYYYRVAASNSTGIARGRAVRFSSPTITLHGQAIVTNQLHTPYHDAGASVFDGPVAIEAHANRSLAVLADGTVLGWGVSADGVLNFPSSATNVIAVTTGEIHGLALRNDGTAVGWGDNSSGQLKFPASATNLVAISAGAWHNLALRADGKIIAWGNNGYFQLNIPLSATNPIAIAAGSFHSLAVLADGRVLGWGESRAGQIAIPASATNVVAVSASSYYNLALRSDGTVVGWGTNDFGQISIPASATNVTAVSAGFRHSLALRTDGTVVAWGDDSFGQIDTPTNATNVIAIAAGAYHSLALQADGTIIGWGKNDSGEANTLPASGFNSVPVTSSDIVNVDSPGTYLLTYSATNLLGGVGQVTRIVVVADSTEPAVTSMIATEDRDMSAPLENVLATPAVNSAHQPVLSALSSPTASIPRLRIATVTGNVVLQISLTEAAGAMCTVVESPNISWPLSDWTILGEAKEVSSGNYRFTVSQTTGTPHKFYRVLLTPKGSF